MKLRMKELRIRRGMKQKEVADLLGIPVRRYGSYEREERALSLMDAALIADVLDVTLDELAGREFQTESGYTDPRQAELNRCWSNLDPERQDRLVGTAHDMEAAKSLGADVSPAEEKVS